MQSTYKCGGLCGPSSRARWILLALGVVLSLLGTAAADDFMFRARIDGKMFEGKPLAWSTTEIALLGRDGQLHVIDPRKAKEAKKIATRFYGYSNSEMKRELYREFGKDFDISTTKHYMVVHPSGEKDKWAARFEELYRSFWRYFRVRGFTQREPEYPLVAVVLHNKDEYVQKAGFGDQMHPNTVGHYDPVTNRVFLFDATSDSGGGDWSHNAETIVHEATHQTAYNVGIHTRFAPAPRWLVEGLATMFEAQGVWDSRHYPDRSDRVNRMRLRDFQDYLASRRQPGSIERLISSDDMFQSDALDAYAEAWALSFFLCETRPKLYAQYLAKTAERPIFKNYTAAERMADFQEVFGDEMRMLDVKFLRFIDELK